MGTEQLEMGLRLHEASPRETSPQQRDDGSPNQCKAKFRNRADPPRNSQHSPGGGNLGLSAAWADVNKVPMLVPTATTACPGVSQLLQASVH